MDSIYGIGYDFYQKNGHYLVLQEKNGEQLAENMLIPLQMRMMESNQIPNLLPLSIEELDFKIRLYYDITSKRNLRSHLKNHTLSSYDFYQLFIQIITTLEQSKLYMLNEHHYILNEDFIYVGKDAKELFLMYLPMDSFEKEGTTLEELKKLLASVVKRVESLQGSEQKHITQYAEDPAFSLKGLKELLLDLQRLRPTPYNGYQPQPFQQQVHTPFQQQNPDPFQANGQNPQLQGMQQQVQPNAAADNPIKTEKAPSKKKKKKDTAATGKRGSAFTQRQKVYIIVLALLTLTIIWKVYEAIPNQGMLYTSGVLSIVVLAAGIFLFLKRANGEITAIEEVAAGNQQLEPQVQNMHMGQGMNHPTYAPYGGQQPYYNSVGAAGTMMPQNSSMQGYNIESNISQNQPVQQPINKERTENHYYQEPQPSFSLDTNLLVENDDTVLLADGEEEDNSFQQKLEPYLEVERDGEREKISLSESHYTIGRNEEAVHYVEDSVGVSRIHLEFIQIDNSYGVKDLGSRNGTKLNGETLVPYKIYALNEEDIISIGKVEYRFLWE
ncbi:DUF6382 domain-containing protein [Cytobacillus massiliigabonensis]|uniref:DUF6382 domain-containing protein n=1 Tax=Cytobacillus massiliigabonensis TaxID=1871011 RepID=UPI000C835CF6|nr:DUF6382 domain-containing protein [Cytobacillus massiliigabonensis]